MFSEFARFAVVGVAATATTYTILIMGVEILGLSPVIASMIGYAAGIVVNYSLNYRFTFRSSHKHLRVFPKFLLVMVLGMMLNGAVMFACSEWLGMHYLLAQLFAVAIVLFWSFFANRMWTFSR